MTRRNMLTVVSAAALGTVAETMAASTASAMKTAHAGKHFEGKVVLITKATSGIGEAAARAFADEGEGVLLRLSREPWLGH